MTNSGHVRTFKILVEFIWGDLEIVIRLENEIAGLEAKARSNLAKNKGKQAEMDLA